MFIDYLNENVFVFSHQFLWFMARLSFSPAPCPLSPNLAICCSFSVNCLVLVYEILSSPNILTSSALLAAPPIFIIASSALQRYYYYGPRIEPGLAIRIHPMKSAGGNPTCFIIYKAIKVPVRPRPALQWMAIAPLVASASLNH